MKLNKNKYMHKVLSTTMLVTMLGTTFTPTVASAISLNDYLESQIEEVNANVKNISDEEIENSKNDNIEYNLDELKSVWSNIYDYYKENSVTETYDYVVDNYGDVSLNDIFNAINYYKDEINIDLSDENLADTLLNLSNGFYLDGDIESATLKDIKIEDNTINKSTRNINFENGVSTPLDELTYTTNTLSLDTDSGTYGSAQVVPLDLKDNSSYLSEVSTGTYQFTMPGKYYIEYDLTTISSRYNCGMGITFSDNNNAWSTSFTSSSDYNYLVAGTTSSGWQTCLDSVIGNGNYTGIFEINVSPEQVEAGFKMRLLNRGYGVTGNGYGATYAADSNIKVHQISEKTYTEDSYFPNVITDYDGNYTYYVYNDNDEFQYVISGTDKVFIPEDFEYDGGYIKLLYNTSNLFDNKMHEGVDNKYPFSIEDNKLIMDDIIIYNDGYEMTDTYYFKDKNNYNWSNLQLSENTNPKNSFVVDSSYIKIQNPGVYDIEVNLSSSNNAYVDIWTNFYNGLTKDITDKNTASELNSNWNEYSNGTLLLEDVYVTQDMIDNGFGFYLYAARDTGSGGEDKYITLSDDAYINITRKTSLDEDIYLKTVSESIKPIKTGFTGPYKYSYTYKGEVINKDSKTDTIDLLYKDGEFSTYELTFDKEEMNIYNDEDNYTYTIEIDENGNVSVDRPIILYSRESRYGTESVYLSGEEGETVKVTGQNYLQWTDHGYDTNFLNVDSSSKNIYITEPGYYTFDYSIDLTSAAYLSGLYFMFADNNNSLQVSDLYLQSYKISSSTGTHTGTFNMYITQEMIDNDVYFTIKHQGSSTSSSRYGNYFVDNTYINVTKESEVSNVKLPIVDNGYDYSYIISNKEFDNTTGMNNSFYNSYVVLNQDVKELTLLDGTYYYQLINQDSVTVKDSTVYNFTVSNGEISFSDYPELVKDDNTVTVQLDSKENNILRYQATDSTLNADIDSNEDLFISGENGKIYFNEPGLYTINYNIDLYSEDSLDYLWFILSTDSDYTSADGNAGRNIFQAVNAGVTKGEFEFYISEDMINDNVYLHLWSNAGSGDWGRYNAANTYFEFIQQENVNAVESPINIEDNLDVNLNITTSKPSSNRERGNEIISVFNGNDNTLYLADGTYYVQAMRQDSALQHDDSSYEITINNGIVTSDNINYTKPDTNTYTARLGDYSNKFTDTDLRHYAYDKDIEFNVETTTDSSFISSYNNKIYITEPGYYNINFNVDVIGDSGLDNILIKWGSDSISQNNNIYSMYTERFTVGIGQYSDTFGVYISEEMVNDNIFFTFLSNSGSSSQWGRYDATNTYIEVSKEENVNVSIPYINNSDKNIEFGIFTEEKSSLYNSNSKDMTVSKGIFTPGNNDLNIELEDGTYYIKQIKNIEGVTSNPTKYYFTVKNNEITLDEIPTYNKADDVFIAGYDTNDTSVNETYEMNMTEISDENNIASIDSNGYISFDKAGVYNITLHQSSFTTSKYGFYVKTINSVNGSSSTNLYDNVIYTNEAGEFTFTVNISDEDVNKQTYGFYLNTSTSTPFSVVDTYISVEPTNENVSNLNVTVMDEDGNLIPNYTLDILKLIENEDTPGHSTSTTMITTDNNGQANLDISNGDYIISELENNSIYNPQNVEVNVTEDSNVEIVLKKTTENMATYRLVRDERYLGRTTSGFIPLEDVNDKDFVTLQSDNAIRINEPGYYKINFEGFIGHVVANSEYFKFSNTSSNQDNAMYAKANIPEGQLHGYEGYFYVTQEMIDNLYTFKVQSISNWFHTPNTYVTIEKLDYQDFEVENYDNFYQLGSGFLSAQNTENNNYMQLSTVKSSDIVSISDDGLTITFNESGTYMIDANIGFNCFLGLNGTSTTTRTINSDTFQILLNDEPLFTNLAFGLNADLPTREYSFDNTITFNEGDTIKITNPQATEVFLTDAYIGIKKYSDTTYTNKVDIKVADEAGNLTPAPENISFDLDMQTHNTINNLFRTASGEVESFSNTTNENGEYYFDVADGTYDIELSNWTEGYTNNLESLGTITIKNGEIISQDEIVLNKAIDTAVIVTNSGNKDTSSMYSSGNIEMLTSTPADFLEPQNEGQFAFTEPGYYQLTLNAKQDISSYQSNGMHIGVNPYNTSTWNNRGIINAVYNDTNISETVLITEEMINSNWKLYIYNNGNNWYNYNNTSVEVTKLSTVDEYYNTIYTEPNNIFLGVPNVGVSTYIYDADSDYIDMDTVSYNTDKIEVNREENTLIVKVLEDGVYNFDILFNIATQKSTTDFNYTYNSSNFKIVKNNSTIYTIPNEVLSLNEEKTFTYNEYLTLEAGDTFKFLSTGGNITFMQNGSYIAINEGDIDTTSTILNSVNNTPIGNVHLTNIKTGDEFDYNTGEETYNIPEGRYLIQHTPQKYYSQDENYNDEALIDISGESQVINLNTERLTHEFTISSKNTDNEYVNSTFNLWADENYNGVIDDGDILYDTYNTKELLNNDKTYIVDANQYIVEYVSTPNTSDNISYIVNYYTDKLVFDMIGLGHDTHQFRVIPTDSNYYNIGGTNKGDVRRLEELTKNENNNLKVDSNKVYFNEPGIYQINTNVLVEEYTYHNILKVLDNMQIAISDDSSKRQVIDNVYNKSSANVDSWTINVTEEMINSNTYIYINESWLQNGYNLRWTNEESYIEILKVGNSVTYDDNDELAENYDATYISSNNDIADVNTANPLMPNVALTNEDLYFEQSSGTLKAKYTGNYHVDFDINVSSSEDLASETIYLVTGSRTVATYNVNLSNGTPVNISDSIDIVLTAGESVYLSNTDSNHERKQMYLSNNSYFGVNVLNLEGSTSIETYSTYNDTLLEDARYSIYYDSNQDGVINTNDKIIDTITTNNTSYKTPAGDYMIKQINADEGYLYSEPVYFTVEDSANVVIYNDIKRGTFSLTPEYIGLDELVDNDLQYVNISVYNEEGEFVQTLDYNNGKWITPETLVYDYNYSLKIEGMPEYGYQVNDTFEFNIFNDGEEVKYAYQFFNNDLYVANPTFVNDRNGMTKLTLEDENEKDFARVSTENNTVVTLDPGTYNVYVNYDSWVYDGNLSGVQIYINDKAQIVSSESANEYYNEQLFTITKPTTFSIGNGASYMNNYGRADVTLNSYIAIEKLNDEDYNHYTEPNSDSTVFKGEIMDGYTDIYNEDILRLNSSVDTDIYNYDIDSSSSYIVDEDFMYRLDANLDLYFRNSLSSGEISGKTTFNLIMNIEHEDGSVSKETFTKTYTYTPPSTGKVTLSFSKYVELTEGDKVTFNLSTNKRSIGVTDGYISLVKRGENPIYPQIPTIAPWVTSDKSASIYERESITDEDLIEMFNVDSNAFADINVLEVEQTINPNVAGFYNVKFVITSKVTGETDFSNSTLEVINREPVISGDESHEIYLGDTIANKDLKDIYNVTASEITTGDLNSKIKADDSAVKYYMTGTYPIIFSATDSEGSVASYTAYLTINRKIIDVDPITPEVEKAAPTLELSDYETGDEETILTNEMFIDLFNVQGNFGEVGNRELTVDSSNVNFKTPGKYPVTFTNTDLDTGLSISETVIYHILDIKPTISSDLEQTVYINDEIIDYKDLYNVNATEITDNDLLNNVIVDNSNVDLSTRGAYKITFTVSDEEGNIVKTNAHLIVAENFASNPEGTELDDEELYSEYVTNDVVENHNDITLISDKIDFETPDTYPVTISYVATSGIHVEFNAEYEVEDLLPEITVNETYDAKLNEEFDIADVYELSATEITTGDLTDEVIIDDSEVVYYKTGSYPITFTVSDEEGNKDVVTSTLNIKRNIIDPETIDNSQETLPLELSVDESYSDYEMVAHSDEELLNLLNVNSNADDEGVRTLTYDFSNIDFETPGIYNASVTLTDNISGESITSEFEYEVLDILPTITSNNITTYLGETIDDYKLNGNVIATEITENDLYDSVTVDISNIPMDENNSFNVTGTYPVIYTVSDNEGNEVTSTSELKIKRNIIDINPITPEVNIVDPTLELNNDYYSTNELAQNIEITDEELIELYGVTTNVTELTNRELSVSHNIDLETPGEYEVTFTNKDTSLDKEVSKTAIYEVIDVLPVIEGTSYYKITDLNSISDNDLIEMYEVSASEFEENDLDVTVTHNIDLTTNGIYDITFSSVDSDNNEVSYNAQLEVSNTIIDEDEVNMPNVSVSNTPRKNNKDIITPIVEVIEETINEITLLETGQKIQIFAIIITTLGITIVIYKKLKK